MSQGSDKIVFEEESQGLGTSGGSPPSNPQVGQPYRDPATGILFLWNGSMWLSAVPFDADIGGLLGSAAFNGIWHGEDYIGPRTVGASVQSPDAAVGYHAAAKVLLRDFALVAEAGPTIDIPVLFSQRVGGLWSPQLPSFTVPPTVGRYQIEQIPGIEFLLEVGDGLAAYRLGNVGVPWECGGLTLKARAYYTL